MWWMRRHKGKVWAGPWWNTAGAGEGGRVPAMQFNYVVSTNGPAVALYRKLGFAVVGTLPQAFRHRELGLVDVFVCCTRKTMILYLID